MVDREALLEIVPAAPPHRLQAGGVVEHGRDRRRRVLDVVGRRIGAQSTPSRTISGRANARGRDHRDTMGEGLHDDQRCAIGPRRVQEHVGLGVDPLVELVAVHPPQPLHVLRSRDRGRSGRPRAAAGQGTSGAVAGAPRSQRRHPSILKSWATNASVRPSLATRLQRRRNARRAAAHTFDAHPDAAPAAIVPRRRTAGRRRCGRDGPTGVGSRRPARPGALGPASGGHGRSGIPLAAVQCHQVPALSVMTTGGTPRQGTGPACSGRGRGRRARAAGTSAPGPAAASRTGGARAGRPGWPRARRRARARAVWRWSSPTGRPRSRPSCRASV